MDHRVVITHDDLAAPVMTIIGAFCVRYAGEVYYRTCGYDLLFTTFIAAQVAAAMGGNLRFVNFNSESKFLEVL